MLNEERVEDPSDSNNPPLQENRQGDGAQHSNEEQTAQNEESAGYTQNMVGALLNNQTEAESGQTTEPFQQTEQPGQQHHQPTGPMYYGAADMYGQEVPTEEGQEEYGDEAQIPPYEGQFGGDAPQNQGEPVPEEALVDEDEELKKKIVMYYHPLFQGILSQWFVLLQQFNYNRLTKEQYVDLNVKIQKSLILDFDEVSARESAEQDWKIDLERESLERKHKKAAKGTDLAPINEEGEESGNDSDGASGSSEEFDSADEQFMNDEEKERLYKRRQEREQKRQLKAEARDKKGIDYERLTEFFFDLCLSWCQYLDIETFLFFINGVFLNITKGQHVNVSTFKDLSEIEVLSIEFINHLLAYRQTCQQKVEQGSSYGQWYATNFGRTHQIVSAVEKNLEEAFKGRNETRILDIWVDLPPQIVNHLVDNHFRKMDRDIDKMDMATKTTERLTRSIHVMDQLKKLSQHQQTATQRHKQYANATQPQTLLQNQTALPARQQVQVFNDKTQNQETIEKRLVGQLGERFEHAQLIEISRSSYLISNQVRIPIFGQKIKPTERTEESISKKGYLLMKDAELYSQRIRGPIHKYKLDPNSTLNALRTTEQVYSNMPNKQQQINGVKQQLQSNNPNNLEADPTGTMIATLGGMLPPNPNPNQPTQQNQETIQQQQHVQHQLQGVGDFMNQNDLHQSTRQYNQTLASEQVNNPAQPNVSQSSTKPNQSNIEVKVVGSGSKQNHSTNQVPLVSHSQQQMQQKGAEEALSVLQKANQFQQQQVQQPQRVPVHYSQMARSSNVQQQSNQQSASAMTSHHTHQHQQQMDQSTGLQAGAPSGFGELSGELGGVGKQTSAASFLDENIIQQVYQSYVALLAQDKTARVSDLLKGEPFASLVAQGLVSESELESAVFEKLYAEEESADIQHMIAQFYNKFDELHEQSLTQALAKIPNKTTIKNEVKYRIPERWTKPFHRDDVVSMDIFKGSTIPDERGVINKNTVLEGRRQYEESKNDSLSKQITGLAPINNPILHHSLSGRNVELSPKSHASNSGFLQANKVSPDGSVSAPGQTHQTNGTVPLPPQQQYTEQKSNKQQFYYSDVKPGSEHNGNGDQTTEANSRIDEGDLEEPSRLTNAFGAKHLYDWSEVAYLFDKGEIPDELAAITDPIEYNYLLVRLRKEFNEKHKSNYLRYMNLQLPYHSRRDEVGGTITEDDWTDFVERLEGIITRVDKKRKRIIKRRKRRGKKKMPRKTLFKPEKKVNVAKDPLWREIFIDNHSESDSGDESADEQMERLYKIACQKRGIPFDANKLNGGGAGKKEVDSQSSKSANGNKIELANREKEENIKFPPVKFPSMHPHLRPKGGHLEEIRFERTMKRRAKMNEKHKGKAAAENARQIEAELPHIKHMINMNYDKEYLVDPFEKQPHMAARQISAKQNTIKKMEHTYTESVKKEIQKQKNKGYEGLRQSAITTYGLNPNTKFDFKNDSLMPSTVDKMNSTGQRNQLMMLTSAQNTSEGGEKGGKVYKFKNIHGDRGTFDGLSANALNQPPSSYWRDHHQIPKHLLQEPNH